MIIYNFSDFEITKIILNFVWLWSVDGQKDKTRQGRAGRGGNVQVFELKQRTQERIEIFTWRFTTPIRNAHKRYFATHSTTHKMHKHK